MNWLAISVQLPKITTRACWFAVALCLGACQSSGTPSTNPASFPTRPELQPTARDYKRAYLIQPGGAETDRHVGFVAKEYLEFHGVEKTITTVLNRSLTPVGFYFDEGGATYIYSSDEDYKFLGNHTEQRSLALLFQETGIFRFSEELE